MSSGKPAIDIPQEAAGYGTGRPEGKIQNGATALVNDTVVSNASPAGRTAKTTKRHIGTGKRYASGTHRTTAGMEPSGNGRGSGGLAPHPQAISLTHR